jgi:AcrR family transcriptional regulator
MMSPTTTTRSTAEERREDVLEAARYEFSQHGLHGASTDAIARAAGISQPYLFRLFGTKRQLFLDVNERCFERTLDAFRAAASGTSGEDALRAIGDAYGRLIEEDRTMLQGQLQAYAAAVEDDEVRATVVRGFGRLVDYVEAVSGADEAAVWRFFATGMLFNVLAAMNVVAGEGPREPWVERLTEGCREELA